MNALMEYGDDGKWQPVEAPAPGDRCLLCNRRRNKKRTDESPETVRVVFTLPADRAEPVEEGLDALQELVGADPHSYPKGHLLEALVVLGAQQREELKRYFNGEEGFGNEERRAGAYG